MASGAQTNTRIYFEDLTLEVAVGIANNKKLNRLLNGGFNEGLN